MKILFNKLIQVGKVAIVCMSLLTMLILATSNSFTAIAANPGDPFLLGKDNTILGPTTSLAGKNGDAMLSVSNSAAAAMRLTVGAGKPPLVINDTAGKATNLDADKLDGRDSTTFADGTNGKANSAKSADFATTAGTADKAKNADFANAAQFASSALTATTALELNTPFWSGKTYSRQSGPAVCSDSTGLCFATASCEAQDIVLNVSVFAPSFAPDTPPPSPIASIMVEKSPPKGVVGVLNTTPSARSSVARVLCADFPPLQP